MSYTENVMASQPGIIFGSLDNGDMVTDWDSGEYVPADQVLHDPWHMEKLDLLDQDKFGSLKMSLEDDLDEFDGVSEDDLDEDREDSEVHNQTSSEENVHECILSKQNAFGGNAQNSRTVSVRKQSSSRHKRGKIRDLM